MSEEEISHSHGDSADGILDTVMESEQAHALADFNPELLVSELLDVLREREREILNLRYGLGQQPDMHTLDHIGKKMNLTRERVRQVEQESLKTLRAQPRSPARSRSMDIVKRAVADHGGIFAEHALLDHLLISSRDSAKSRNALLFLLELEREFNFLRETEEYHSAWAISDFQIQKLDAFHATVKVFLERAREPVELHRLTSAFKESDHYQGAREYYTDRVIENLLRLSKHVRANPFGQYGLHTWRAIHPKDVGDKAYLVLKHYKKPLHYNQITEYINQHHFDNRRASKETVHNELIMNPRFVLVGRGTYALAEWGYKKGLVADVIKEILQKAGGPVEREAIVQEVLKHRLVRRNTILVGLSNKKLFRKVGKSKYTLA